MNYIENTYICLAAPLLLAILCIRGAGRRALTFLLAGMSSCLISSYISTFFAAAAEVDAVTASHEIVPVVEEIMKSFPLLFYMLAFQPEKKRVVTGALMVAVGFATFENVCFLTSYGTGELLRVLIRGFGTGAMHVMCGMTVALGLFFLWDRVWLQAIGVFALLSFVISIHAIFNIFVNQTGVIFWIGSAVPLASVLLHMVIFRGKTDLS